jgi:uncharacterized protein (UPF0371 family)
MRQTIKFDKEKYLSQQSDAILERVKRFDNKLYDEFLCFPIHGLWLSMRA